MKLYRIKRNGKFWTLKDSVIPVWTEHGDFFTEDDIRHLLEKFKYQRKLWPADAEVLMYTITGSEQSTIDKELFNNLDKELTFESLKGSAY